MMNRLLLAAFLAGGASRAGAQALQGMSPPARLPARSEGQELVGTKAPEWKRMPWVDMKGHPKLKQLRGHLVLVRWWTDGCLYCVDSAAVLNQLYERYGPRGLDVVGMYHPNPAQSVDVANVREMSELMGFRFPVAVDAKWKSLKKWWLKGKDRTFTMATFLVDQEGVIQWVHPGGTYGEADANELELKIVKLLGLPGPAVRKK